MWHKKLCCNGVHGCFLSIPLHLGHHEKLTFLFLFSEASNLPTVCRNYLFSRLIHVDCFSRLFSERCEKWILPDWMKNDWRWIGKLSQASKLITPNEGSNRKQTTSTIVAYRASLKDALAGCDGGEGKENQKQQSFSARIGKCEKRIFLRIYGARK